jgi:hypothetical protein
MALLDIVSDITSGVDAEVISDRPDVLPQGVVSSDNSSVLLPTPQGGGGGVEQSYIFII